ncbi:MAG: DUF4838 domain-containing protein [Clostridia bacterium]|nr:DUF4838 domain-containing protein [Clostridia bacterium]
MFKIYTVNAHPSIDFAAQELRKYLRMMMPRCGEIKVLFDENAKDGFRLGLMSDFGIDPDVENTYLDDVIYVKTDENGGVIAGCNTRSVLQAVYRFLKKQGCIWLFPGPDGERIPVREGVTPVDYFHKASLRYRGQCNEGAESQPQMFDAIAFTPKVGLNTFMMEHDYPHHYYNHFYKHPFDEMESEGAIPNKTLIQWKRACENEIEKRGLFFHDMGHGWTSNPFGFDDLREMSEQEREQEYKKDKYIHTAMVKGKRGLWGGYPLDTNLCMSNPETRSIVAKYVADYASKQDNVDFLHVWLADNFNNHCECENCRKKTPSDWYVALLNDIDAELIKKDLPTHIVFIAYNDTLWAPESETLKNPDRFSLLFAPISRFYNETYGETPVSETMPFKLNNVARPRGMGETLSYLNKWQEIFKGDAFCYEYYFWRFMAFDMSTRLHAKIIYEDCINQKKNGLSGMVNDGSQRAFFPHGFSFFLYGETMYDTDRTFEELEEEYFSAAYGSDWKKVVEFFDKIDKCSDYMFLGGHKSTDLEKGRHYNPSVCEKFEKIPAIADEFLTVIKSHLDTPVRCEYVSWNLLEWYCKYLKLLSKALCHKAKGEDEKAYEAFLEIQKEMGPLDLIRHDSYDHFAFMAAINSIFKLRK